MLPDIFILVNKDFQKCKHSVFLQTLAISHDVGIACELSLLEQTNNIRKCYVNTVIENTVNNQRKQNKHPGIKENLHRLCGIDIA